MLYTFECTSCKYQMVGEHPLPACPDCELPHTMRTITPEQLELPLIYAFTDPLAVEVQKAYDKAFAIWRDRQKKYGPSNIAITGALGCYVRSQDKLARLGMVYKNGTTDTPDESIEDSWLDLLNYAMMGYLCHKGLWPKE